MTCVVADPPTVHAALKFIENVLRHGKHGVQIVEELNGIEYLETLQYSEGSNDREWQNLCQRAQLLVDEFYGEFYGVEDNGSSPPVNLPINSDGAGRGKAMTMLAWMNQ